MFKKLTILISVLVLACVLTGVVSAELIGHWKFDHKGPSEIYAYDEVDPPHDGELAGGGVGGTDAPDWTSYGVIDGALIFDGDIRDYVNFGPDDIFDLRDAFTLSCWIKIDTDTIKRVDARLAHVSQNYIYGFKLRHERFVARHKQCSKKC